MQQNVFQSILGNNNPNPEFNAFMNTAINNLFSPQAQTQPIQSQAINNILPGLLQGMFPANGTTNPQIPNLAETFKNLKHDTPCYNLAEILTGVIPQTVQRPASDSHPTGTSQPTVDPQPSTQETFAETLRNATPKILEEIKNKRQQSDPAPKEDEAKVTKKKGFPTQQRDTPTTEQKIKAPRQRKRPTFPKIQSLESMEEDLMIALDRIKDFRSKIEENEKIIRDLKDILEKYSCDTLVKYILEEKIETAKKEIQEIKESEDYKKCSPEVIEDLQKRIDSFKYDPTLLNAFLKTIEKLEEDMKTDRSKDAILVDVERMIGNIIDNSNTLERNRPKELTSTKVMIRRLNEIRKVIRLEEPKEESIAVSFDRLFKDQKFVDSLAVIAGVEKETFEKIVDLYYPQFISIVENTDPEVLEGLNTKLRNTLRMLFDMFSNESISHFLSTYLKIDAFVSMFLVSQLRIILDQIETIPPKSEVQFPGRDEIRERRRSSLGGKRVILKDEVDNKATTMYMCPTNHKQAFNIGKTLFGDGKTLEEVKKKFSTSFFYQDIITGYNIASEM